MLRHQIKKLKGSDSLAEIKSLKDQLMRARLEIKKYRNAMIKINGESMRMINDE